MRASPVQPIQEKGKHHRHDRDLAERIECGAARVCPGHPVSDQKKAFHQQCMKVWVMVRSGRPSQDLFNLPYCIIVQPARIIHEIVRHIAEQAEHRKEHVEIPSSGPMFSYLLFSA